MNGLLFPGQGSQKIGMGKELYDKFSSARHILEEANDILGYDLKTLMFEGPQEQLTDTKYAQPAIYTCSAMYLEKFKSDGLDYNYVAGHSLGEYNALLAAGVFSFSDGLKLIAQRGDAMSRMNGKGIMAAVMGLNEEELSPFMVPGVVMANLNTKTQIVISGEEAGINAIGEKLAENEAVKFKKLHVSAAFHSPQMKEAAEIMKPVIENTKFSISSCNIISNVTGKPSINLAEIKTNLIEQITGQVRWHDTVMEMKKAGVSMFYEVGYGDVLKKMNKTITFRPKCIGVEL